MQARNCYVERSNLNSDDFVLMILLDSCLVIEAILRGTADDVEEQIDYLFKPIMIFDVRKDIILLENQLPFFILDGIYRRAFTDQAASAEPLFKLSIRYLFDLMLIKGVDETINKVTDHITQSFKVNHFVDLLRICHLPPNTRSTQASSFKAKFLSIPNLVGLSEAGIRFKMSSSTCLLDIKFSAGILEIQDIKLHNNSECLLRNLVALEHCHYPFDSYIIDYVFFMNALLGNVDVPTNGVNNLLIQNESNLALAAVFNDIRMRATLMGSKYYFHHLSNDLNAYVDIPRNRLKAAFKRDYFKTPSDVVYIIFSVVVALTLTLIQTICSLLSVPKKS